MFFAVITCVVSCLLVHTRFKGAFRHVWSRNGFKAHSDMYGLYSCICYDAELYATVLNRMILLVSGLMQHMKKYHVVYAVDCTIRFHKLTSTEIEHVLNRAGSHVHLMQLSAAVHIVPHIPMFITWI